MWTRGALDALDFHGIVFGQIISYDYVTMGVYMIGWFWGWGNLDLGKQNCVNLASYWVGYLGLIETRTVICTKLPNVCANYISFGVQGF